MSKQREFYKTCKFLRFSDSYNFNKSIRLALRSILRHTKPGIAFLEDRLIKYALYIKAKSEKEQEIKMLI